jgi:hypothetical protein
MMTEQENTRQEKRQDQVSGPEAHLGQPDPVNTAISSGHVIDEVGGAGLGLPPGDNNTATGVQPPERRASDPQDRRNPEQ